jgi:hypothetical protein
MSKSQAIDKVIDAATAYVESCEDCERAYASLDAAIDKRIFTQDELKPFFTKWSLRREYTVITYGALRSALADLVSSIASEKPVAAPPAAEKEKGE